MLTLVLMLLFIITVSRVQFVIKITFCVKPLSDLHLSSGSIYIMKHSGHSGTFQGEGGNVAILNYEIQELISSAKHEGSTFESYCGATVECVCDESHIFSYILPHKLPPKIVSHKQQYSAQNCFLCGAQERKDQIYCSVLMVTNIVSYIFMMNYIVHTLK